MQAVAAGYGVPERRELTGEDEAEGYVKEFTRHSNDVLLNLNELRRRDILTDATLLVGTARLRAHCAVLVACSGFFYSLFSRRLLNAGGGEHGVSLTLPEGLDAGSVSLLLDFMYTSRLPLTPRTVPGVLTAATYLQMEHVADTCRAFLQQRGWNAAPPPQRELNAGPHTVSMAPPSSWIRPPTARGEDFNKRTTRALGESWASLEPEACLSPMTGSQSLKTEEPELPAQAPTTPSPRSPSQSTCQPNSPAESSTSKLTPQLMSQSGAQPTPNPKACNWKKYKYIILNPLCATSIKEEGPGEGYQECDPVSSTTDRMDLSAQPANQVWSKEVPGYVKRHDQDPPCSTLHPKPPPTPLHGPLPHPPTALSQEDRATYLIYPPPCPPALDMAKQTSSPLCKPNPVKCESQCSMFCYPENQSGAKSVCPGEKPYRCNVCGAQFNRPANLKTHSRIHSGEKPYRCDTCGARFVQVAHLRAHVLIHTGEKPYPCHTCGTRFRHLQTLKSHLRIHTGEKPYSCEKCDLHFRHKSQLRLHLRQKHGAITNTKIRYKVLSEPYRAGPAVLQAC